MNKFLKEIPDEAMELLAQPFAEFKTKLLGLHSDTLDHSTHKWICTWHDEPNAFELLYLLDHCVHYSLCGDALISIMDAFLGYVAKRDGVTEDQLLEFAKTHRAKV